MMECPSTFEIALHFAPVNDRGALSTGNRSAPGGIPATFQSVNTVERKENGSVRVR